MKKITLLAVAFAFSICSFAENKPKAKLTGKAHKIPNHFQSNTRRRNTPPATLATAIWSDDFSVPSHWLETGNALPSDATLGNWQIGTVGPVGGSYGIGNINSTTASNGFAWFDSNGDASGNEIADLTTKNHIDLSAHPNVRLIFEEWYEEFADSTFIFVSNDSVTWVKYPVNVAIQDNEFCGGGANGINPTTVKVDITPTAGGQSKVWIRFEYWSPTSYTENGAPGWGYAWEVDDISIIDKPADDMTLNAAYSDFSYTNGGFYTQTPMSEIAPITFRGALFNSGVNTESNVIFNANISNGSSSVYNQTSTPVASFASSMADTVSIATSFTPPATYTTYTTTFNVSESVPDMDSTDNTIIGAHFSISDTVYARDNGDTVGVGFASPAQYTGGNTDQSQLANLFYFPHAATVTSISVFVTDSSTTGTFFDPVLLDSAFNNITTGADYNINGPSTTNRWVTLPITPTTVGAGSTYYAGIIVYGNSIGKVTVANDATTPQPLGGSVVDIYGAPSGTNPWGAINGTPFIRLNTMAVTGIPVLSSNGNLKLYQNIPNPSSQSTIINYELATPSAVSMKIYNVTGKLMMDLEQGNQVSGKHAININTASLANGVYYYTLYAGNASLTKRLVEVK